jgi:membrane-associated progesterone receptor component
MAFGGRDASRGLATFSVQSTVEGYDDLSDLNTMEMDSVREWEMQFRGEGQYMYIKLCVLCFLCVT